MALFLSADIHQGDERFNVHSRGKQCAFMSLSALLTARNIPLNLWSRITFKNAFLDPGVGFLSVENLPAAVNVACCTNLLNDFSYAICQTAVQARTTASPVMVTNNDSHIVEEQFEAQNNIIETQTYSTELTTQSKTTSPMRVTNTTSPMRVTNTTSPMRVTNTTSPMRVTNTTSPMRVTNTTSPMRVTNTTSPVRVTDTTSPMRVTDTTSPMRVIDTTSPMRVTNTTSPMRVTDTTSPMRVTKV